MRLGSIRHPEKEPLIKIHRWQIEICDGDVTAAALLSFFEYWHDIKEEFQVKAKRANDIAEIHGDPRSQDESLLQFHSEQELADGIMIAKRDSIRKGIKLLEEKGFISIHKNPNPRYAFDRTRYFLFHPDPINQWLDSDARSSKNRLSMSKNRRRSSENTSPSSVNASAITEITPETTSEISLSPTSLSNELPDEYPPPTPKERERELSLKAEENSQRGDETSPLRSGKKTKLLHNAKNPDLDTHNGGVAVAKIYEIEPGMINQDFLEWRSRYYSEQGGKWAKAPVSNALSDIQKSESRALALWQDYQNSIARQLSAADQPLEFAPAQMTDRQHKDWAQEYQTDPEKFMAKPEAAAWLVYVEARPSFKEMIFGDKRNGTTAQQGQPARIQREKTAPVSDRSGGGGSRSNPARSRGSDEQGSGSNRGGSLLRDLAQDCLQDLLEPLQGG